MRTVIAWIIVLVWTALYVRKIIDPSFPVPAEVTPVMLIAAGYFFGRDVKEKLKDRVKKVIEADES